MHINGFHHVAIICSDYGQSKHFYITILGGIILEETYRPERQSYKLDIKIGNSQIELFSFPAPPERPSYPEACGLRHLAFEVTNITEAVDHLEFNEVLVEPVRTDEITGKKFTFCADPDGLPIEFYES